MTGNTRDVQFLADVSFSSPEVIFLYHVRKHFSDQSIQ